MNNDNLKESFFEECEELLEAMHEGFSNLSKEAHSPETMNAIFRAVHSIKGGAGAFGLEKLVKFAHEFENALDMLRSGKITLDQDLLQFLQACGDRLSDIVNSSIVGEEYAPENDDLMDRLVEITNLGNFDVEPDFSPRPLEIHDLTSSNENGKSAYQIKFSPRAELYSSGHEPHVLISNLKSLGDINVEAKLSGTPRLSGVKYLDSFIKWEIVLTTTEPIERIFEIFEFAEGLCEITILEEENLLSNDDPKLALDTKFGSETRPDLAKEKPLAKLERFEKKTQNSKIERHAKSRGTIRVDLEKVDKLINMVGELVIKEAMLSQAIDCLKVPSESDLNVGLDNLKQLAGDIQEGVMAIRAQPVKPMFQRMSRIAREASATTGKKVNFTTTGENTEVDRTVIERLVDPLTHMIRNAIDHGLEASDKREAAGKRGEGTVTLSAAHRSGRVIIEVADDGNGVDRDRVLATAIEKKLIPKESNLSPSEVDNLLFLPGFSSKEEVSELSGRGVGLDVARNEIQGLGGKVSIFSEPGKGTTFSISLPLTLAVLEGMVIRVASQTMVVPISAVQETLQPDPSSINLLGTDHQVLQNRDSIVQLVDLGHLFELRSKLVNLEDRIFLLVENEQRQTYALIVDEIQDQRQVVIKSLEENYKQISGISAATILGDGRIALIIDPDGIFDISSAQNKCSKIATKVV